MHLPMSSPPHPRPRKKNSVKKVTSKLMLGDNTNGDWLCCILHVWASSYFQRSYMKTQLSHDGRHRVRQQSADGMWRPCMFSKQKGTWWCPKGRRKCYVKKIVNGGQRASRAFFFCVSYHFKQIEKTIFQGPCQLFLTALCIMMIQVQLLHDNNSNWKVFFFF